ncbi:class I SAM-dependent methyltransferase [Curvibacter sp. HBC28]|uniref:Class I SAM-dependent methyltransferase n=1 Tax=Curvibacter microcysteis TaxID=3026419 RepID=A0ABT5MFN3_9BURK|nr:class I SAM-dependent methyltransferase [Curvibacter sp. HBC28]MDD0815394.1 class I SAM-dependent methyltransferase [Curvibacter sp. HBC28]
MNFPSQSKAMTLLRRLGLDPLAWALRRFHTPVPASALVLEVGSGGNPYPRANVLLDAYENTRERHWAPLASDRPTVLGFVENLPFKDHAFDFVIAAHVLEHSSAPAQFLSELQRVAKAGYIEVPDALMERLNPYRDHRLEITCRDQTLLIRKKAGWQHDVEVVELYEDRVKRVMTQDLIPRHPFEFHVRYYWDQHISFSVLNPEVDASWPAPASAPSRSPRGLAAQLRPLLRDTLRDLLSQKSRNVQIDLLSLLRCTHCHGVKLQAHNTQVECQDCGHQFPVRQKLIAMNEGVSRHTAPAQHGD